MIVRTGHPGGKIERDQSGVIPSEVYRFVDQAVKLVQQRPRNQAQVLAA